MPSFFIAALVAALAALAPATAAAPAGCSANNTYWYDSPSTKHGKKFANVKDFGALGDGVTDDTAAIHAALTTGRSPTYTTANVLAVYFPPGTYIVSASLPIYFYTFISGSPCAPSVVKMADNKGFGGYIFDGDSGQGEWGDDDDQFYRSRVASHPRALHAQVAPLSLVSQTPFPRSISHLTIVNGAGNAQATGIHWAQSQAAHLRNVTIDMSAGGKSGFFGENGSGGFIDGLTIIGGTIPFNFVRAPFGGCAARAPKAPAANHAPLPLPSARRATSNSPSTTCRSLARRARPPASTSFGAGR